MKDHRRRTRLQPAHDCRPSADRRALADLTGTRTAARTVTAGSRAQGDRWRIMDEGARLTVFPARGGRPVATMLSLLICGRPARARRVTPASCAGGLRLHPTSLRARGTRHVAHGVEIGLPTSLRAGGPGGPEARVLRAARPSCARGGTCRHYCIASSEWGTPCARGDPPRAGCPSPRSSDLPARPGGTLQAERRKDTWAPTSLRARGDLFERRSGRPRRADLPPRAGGPSSMRARRSASLRPSRARGVITCSAARRRHPPPTSPRAWRDRMRSGRLRPALLRVPSARRDPTSMRAASGSRAGRRARGIPLRPGATSRCSAARFDHARTGPAFCENYALATESLRPRPRAAGPEQPEGRGLKRHRRAPMRPSTPTSSSLAGR